MMNDGVYFNMPEDVYHAIPRQSSSHIQNLLVSPGTFYAKSWLNLRKANQLAAAATFEVERQPWARDLAEQAISELRAWQPELEWSDIDPKEVSTAAQQLGKAYHCAKLEPDLLSQRFARKPSRSDFPDCKVWTGTDIERQFVALEQPKKKAGETVEDQARRLEESGYEGTIFPLEIARFNEWLGSRLPIDAEFWDQMTEDVAQLLESDLSDLLHGGAAEVVVLFTFRGIRMKVKIDYLRPDAWTDLKTFDNTRGKNVLQAIVDAFQWNRGWVQAAVYREAVESIRTQGLQIVGSASDEQRKLIAQIQMRPEELECWFVYQEKNGIPNVFARKCKFFDVPLSVTMQHAGASAEAIATVDAANRTPQLWFQRAQQAVATALQDFADYSQIYDRGQAWRPIRSRGEFSDDDFSNYFLEQREVSI
jgi:hypothetical protein